MGRALFIQSPSDASEETGTEGIADAGWIHFRFLLGNANFDSETIGTLDLRAIATERDDARLHALFDLAIAPLGLLHGKRQFIFVEEQIGSAIDE